MDFRPLFIFGVARSGTNLLARMLDLHSQIAIALDPFLPLFKSLRNAALRDAGLGAACAEEAPFQDCYFAPAGPAMIDAVLQADLGAELRPDDLPRLRAAVAARAGLESSDLPERLRGISGRSHGDAFADGLARIAAARGSDRTRIIGIKELWTVDFLPALARWFPTARFLVLERDPRAVIASLAAMATRDPTQKAHAVSYARHWRKAVALTRRFAGERDLAPRLMRVGYETLIAESQPTLDAICRFIGVDFDTAMLRIGEAVDRTNGRSWRGNSSFASETSGIDQAAANRWRTTLPESARVGVEFLCAPEMRLAGYAPMAPSPGELTRSVIAWIAAENRDPGSWRSDSGDLAAELGFELLRHNLLLASDPEAPIDLVRRCFLFEATYHALRDAAGLQDRGERRRKAMP